MAATRATLSLPTPYLLQPSLRLLTLGSHDPCMRLEVDRVSMGVLTPAGAVAIQAAISGRHLDVTCHGEGAVWLQPHLPALFGLQDQPEAFQPTGRVKALVDRYAGTHLPTLPFVFHRLLQIVLQQLVSWKDAASGWRDLVHAFGQRAPGPWELWIGPTASRLRQLGYYDLVECGVLPRQAQTILRLARRAAEIEQLASKPDQLERMLADIPGIGPWTIQYLRGTALGDADAVLLGDYGLPHAVAWLLQNKPRSNDDEMQELLLPYQGHRFRIIHLIQIGAVKPPRFGPRRMSNRRRFGIGRSQR